MKIKLEDGSYMPERAHETDAGLDLRSREDKVVPAGGSAVFDTGVHVELPSLDIIAVEYYETEKTCGIERSPKSLCTVGLLKSKSGMNVNHNITNEGVIDMGYTGSIVVKLYNHGTEDYHVKRGDKISQLVILPILTPTIELVDKLDDTERGDCGFGSTGR